MMHRKTTWAARTIKRFFGTCSVCWVVLTGCGGGFDCAADGQACVSNGGAEVGLDCCEGLRCVEEARPIGNGIVLRSLVCG